MTRDEVSGHAVPAPAEAPAGTPASDAGEGGAVRTAVRDTGTDAADAVDARPDGADDPGRDTTADGTGTDSAVAAPDDTAPESDGGVVEGDEPPTVVDTADDARREAAEDVPAAETSAGDGVEAATTAVRSERAADAADDAAEDGGAVDRAEDDAAEDRALAEAPADAAADDRPTGDEPTVAQLPSGETTRIEPSPARSGAAFEEVTSSYVVQDAPAEMSPSELRVDFGAHLEANYQRLVAQLYAITLNADQAHSVVQDAYSRAWRNWAVIGRSADPTGWVRRVAVRTTMRSWRHVLARFGLARKSPPVPEGLDERTTALLTALRELPPPERRSVVLFHMAGLSTGEIAAVEQVSPTTVSTRLDRARRVVMGDTGDLLTGVIELPGVVLDDDRGYVDEMTMPAADPPSGVGVHLDDRWERADTWSGGPDGSWLVSEAPPYDAPSSDPWPGGDSSHTSGRTGDDDQPGRGNDPREEIEERAYAAGDSGVLIDEFDTVAPDGTTVRTADIPFGARHDEAQAGSDEDGEGAVADGGSVRGAEADSEDRR